jgi:hypothetical protein
MGLLETLNTYIAKKGDEFDCYARGVKFDERLNNIEKEKLKQRVGEQYEETKRIYNK